MSGRHVVTVLSAVLAAAVVLVSGCGVRPTGITRVGALPTGQGPVVNNTIYFVKDGRLVPVVRPGLPGAPLMPLWQLGYGVTDNERQAGLDSTLPGIGIVAGLPDPSPDGIRPPGAPPAAIRETDDSGTVTVALQTTIRPEKWPRLWQAQLACTAQAIPGVKKVELNIFDGRPGHTVRCADYRDLLSTATN